MRRIARLTSCLMVLAMLSLLPGTVMGDDKPAAPEPDKPETKEKVDAVQAAIDKVNELDNGLTINREKSSIDIQAKVCLRVGEFLEMFACSPDTREHESILVVQTKPSTIHLALLLLGLEPGKPLSYDMQQDPPKLIPAKGPKVRIVIAREVEGVELETPANRWVKDNKTDQMMKGNTWLFVGSQQKTYEDKTVYLADVNGSAVSLVNFGDDLLTLANDLTHDNSSHNKVWAPRTKAIPEVGTQVILRLYAEPPDKPEKADEPEKPAEPEPAADEVPAPQP